MLRKPLLIMLCWHCYTLVRTHPQIRNQNDDLREWIDYHIALGVSRFYMFDAGGGGRTPATAVIQDLIDDHTVIYHDTHTNPKKQNRKYERCIRQYRNKHQWLAFIDVDEFIVIDDQTKSLPEMLIDFEDYGGVALNWIMFGSSGKCDWCSMSLN
jgi:Glycosyltransferase family 92